MMADEQPFWTLEDYRRYLSHDEAILRDWAADRIKEQYPGQWAESVAPLLADPDPLNVATAADAVGESGDPRYEGALLAALPPEPGHVRYRVLPALGQVRSPAMLPQLIAGLDASLAESPRGREGHEALAHIEALGFYPDAGARAALWRFVERHPYVDDLNHHAFRGLLRFATPEDVDRLARRYAHLVPGVGHGWLRISNAFADVVGLVRPAEEAALGLDEGPNRALAEIEGWLDQWLPWPSSLQADLRAAARAGYREALPLVAAKLQRLAAERGEGWAGGQASWEVVWPQGPGGGLAPGPGSRCAYSTRLVEALAQHPPQQALLHRQAVALALALLGQCYVDEDDEAALAAATGEPSRREVLFQILGSPRMNVLPDVVERVAALGPDALPGLLAILERGRFWALLRAVRAVEALARAHPGAADPAIPLLLNLIHDGQSDYLLEGGSNALRALGPAMVAPAAARMGQGDWVYDIYVQGAIAEVPVEASMDAVLHHSDEVEFGEMEVTHLAALGHPRGFAFLQPRYDPEFPEMTNAIYVLGLLTGYDGPEVARWRRLVYQERAEFAHTLYESRDRWLAELEEEETLPKPGTAARTQKRAAQRRRKQKRAQGRAQRRAQRRKKKKR